MPRAKYRYNPKTLSYERAKYTPLEKVLRTLAFIAPTIVLSVVFAYFLSQRIDSPKEIALAKENEFYQEQFEKMNADMDLMAKVLGEMKERDRNIYRVAFNADVFPDELRNMGIGGANRYESLDGYSNSALLKLTAQRIDSLESKLYGQSLSFKELVQIAKDKENRIACIPAIQPVSNKDLKHVASGYGWRIDPIYKTQKKHTGMDFSSPIGTEVFATGKGKVICVETDSWGYGKHIIIDHGYGYQTLYGHLSEYTVKVGQKVERGDLIGLVGSTGKSTGPHLHYEVIKHGEKVNPAGYYHSDLSPEEYERLIQISNNALKSFD
jgi:murein DD-endopeptidase MepM/ murein hydrolase activator NlpD